MKTRTLILAIILLFPSLVFGQNVDIKSLKGSWMGTITNQESSLRVILKFEVTNNKVNCYFDSPDQARKDLPFNKVWVTKDSLFAEAENSLIFKGLIVPGDSVIDGIWVGVFPLKLKRTQYVYTLKTNLNPEVKGYKILNLIKSTPIKNQQLTGDCWSFATTSFIETEAIRLGKNPVVLSPMFYVTPTYINKAEKYIRMQGENCFGEGDLTFSVLKAYKEFGAIPESVYSGKIDPDARHNHFEMNDSLLGKVKSYVNSGKGNMTTIGYRTEIARILAITLGKAPETFIYQQKQYTPKSFAKEMIGINPDDYVEITSYNHHPFYTKFILEIPSNWDNNYYLNLPIDDFCKVIDNALLHNYSLCWDGDIFEGYNDGFATLGDNKIVTQDIRQDAFDNQTTTDVHNMHIIGIAEDEKGNRFYILKNSSDNMNCGGYLYMSKDFLIQKTISVMVNKGALPKELVKKLGNNL